MPTSVMAYRTFGPDFDRQNSDTSNNTSTNREVSIFHSTVRTKDSPFGKYRVLSDLETIEIVFLIIATLSILGTVAMTIYRLVNVIDESDSTFGIVLLVNAVFALLYVFHGVFWERPYELWAFIAATILITLYCVIEFAVKSPRTTVKIVRLVFVLVFAPIDVALSFKISMQHYTSKNLIIRTLRSANIKFQNMCMYMFSFQTLLKFDLQIELSLVVLVLTSGIEHASTFEITIVVIGIVWGMIWLTVGYLLSRFEKHFWVYLFLVLSIPVPAYVMYKIIKVGMRWDQSSDTIKGTIIACACLFLVTRCIVSYFLWIVVNNFGKGLKQAVYYPDDKQDGTEAPEAPEAPKIDQGDQSTPSEKPADDYLGENVHDDIH